jgi:uncharacterized UPF0160 family protein
MVGREISGWIDRLVNSWYPARSIVERAIVAASAHEANTAQARIAILEQSCPWKSHLYELEQQLGVPPILFVVYADNDTWRVQAVSLGENSFANRVDLAWKGLRDDSLSNASKIEHCVFVHVNGFIGGNRTRDGAIAMALRSIDIARHELSPFTADIH